MSHVQKTDKQSGTAATGQLSVSLAMDKTLDVVVVGAGMAGLSAAAQLSSAGLRSVEVS